MSFSKFKLGKRDTHEVDRTEDYYGDRKRYSSGQKNYFDGSDEEEEGQMTSSVAMEAAKRSIGDYRMAKEGVVAAAEEEDDEDDPLDAFMAGIETQIKQEKSKPATTEPKAVREDIEGEDDQESYFNAVANAPLIILDEDDELQLEYDRDGNPIIPESARVIDPLPPIDHSEISYKSFEKNFYEEDEKVKNLTKQEVKDLRKKLGIRVSGFDPPNPCVSFAHFGFDNHLMALIRKSEFSTPTPIQSQSIPAALKGRDIIGIAQTGSGKTVSYLWPLMVHCVDQPELKEGDGPIALICTPTRELCQQVYHQAKKFAKAYNLSVCCVYGGGNRYEQSQALKEGCEILVATPGRLIDLVKLKATNLQRVTFLVMDEADRMFDLGFEPQVRSIANHVRPDRQTLLFSATFRKKIEKLCRDILTDPIRIVIGDLGEANTDITQTVKVFEDPKNKWVWLMNYLVSFVSGDCHVTCCHVMCGSIISWLRVDLLHKEI
jgi:ATP-dependent RNA helicase DDX42